MRACPVFVQLYEAGYRNIRIYDGAMLEWSYVGANVTYGVSPYRVYMIEVDESLATSIEGIYVEPKYSEILQLKILESL